MPAAVVSRCPRVGSRMALMPKLEMRAGQQLVMTPQLQQAIRLLQFSNFELSQFVEQELERNPLLERDDGEQAEPAVPLELADALPTVEAATDDWLDRQTSVSQSTAEVDCDAATMFPHAGATDLGPQDSGWASLRTSSGQQIDDDSNLEAYVASEISLKDHLRAQSAIGGSNPVDRIIAATLIDLVDDAGYLTEDVASVADRLGCAEADVARVLALMQTCDPPGVFARTLAECLALQLKDQNRYDPQIAQLLENLPLLAAHNLSGLKKAVGVDIDELTSMIAEIKSLSPKPGLRFGSVPMQPVIPDVIVRAAGDGGWTVELNSETLPRVLVNRSYFTRVSKTSAQARDKDYLAECLQTANWLAKSLDQRARTILRVGEEIVRQQDGFFSKGVQYLRPLNLKTVADAIKMHESTVSRVTSNKYVATPRGIFELKFFFTSAIASVSNGEAHSSESVRHRIRQLIDGEVVASILSDDTIVDLLRKDGIEIARRTVAKYREAMRIPSSVQRRREKRMNERATRLAS
jgi:RNA polymerase sigma-54 factor